MTPRFRITAIAALFSSVLMIALPTSASPADNPLFDLTLEELLKINIRSASLFDSDALTIGSSVGVMQADDWQRQAARQTLDAIRNQPGTMLLPSVYGFDVIAVRGYAQVSSSRGIATTLDGIPMNGVRLGSGQFSAQNVGLGVLDRIELIRGPGSSIYGTDAFHGVLSMTSFESQENLTRISAEGGMNDYYQAGAQHSVGFGEGSRLNLAFSASEEQLTRDYRAMDQDTGLMRTFKPDEYNQSQTGILKLSLNPSPTLNVVGGLYLLNYQTYDYPGAPGLVTDSDWNSRTEAAQVVAAQTLRHGRMLEARAYYVNTESDRSLVVPLGSLGNVLADVDTREERAGTTLTFRQAATEDRSTRYAVAVGYDDSAFSDGSFTTRPIDGSSAPADLGFADEGKSRYVGYLLLDARTVLPVEQWSLNYGVRLDRYSDLGTQTSPKLGLIFEPVKNTAIKLLYNNAFRAPTTNERFLPFETVAKDLEPETLDSYELVLFKQSERWSAELVLFETHWDDSIALKSVDTDAGFTFENSGKNEAQGLEASLTWLPEDWRFDLSGSFVESRNSTTDTDYTLFPKFIGTLGVGRTLSDDGTEIYINTHVFDQVKDIPPGGVLSTPENLPAFWRTDISLRKPLTPDLQLFINILNVFDRDNRNPSVLGFPGGVSDRPFTVSAGLRYQM